MKRFVFAAVAVTALTGVAQAQDSLAYWPFSNQGLPNGGFGFQPGEFPFPADFGLQAGTATLNVGGGITGDTTVSGGGDTVYTWIQSFAGTGINAQFGEPSGGSIAIQNGTNGGNNGSYIDLEFDASNYEDIVLSFAGQRTSSGFDSMSIDAFDGATFLGNVATINDLASFALRTVTTSLLDDVADARLRMTFSGGSTTSSTGNNRFDNIFIQGTQIPSPGSLALLGLGGLVAARRRRA